MTGGTIRDSFQTTVEYQNMNDGGNEVYEKGLLGSIGVPREEVKEVQR